MNFFILNILKLGGSMNKLILVTLMLIALVIGCASSGVTKVGAIEIPDWYLNPPAGQNYLYGKATATSADLQLAIDKAKQGARLDIAENLESHIMGLVKKFDEEVGGGEESEYLTQFTQVSKNVVDQTLVGSRENKTQVKEEDQGFRAFVLMELPIGKAREELLKQLTTGDNANLYTRFRASQSFQELQEEVEKLREYKNKEDKDFGEFK
jgi:hypothetical protein